MKKLFLMVATLVMCFAFTFGVMAAPSPEDEFYEDNTQQEKIDKETQYQDDEFYNDNGDSGTKNDSNSKTTTTTTTSSSTSASPKTGDQGAPVTLVYVSLAAAALAVYAAKHVKEQY